MGIIFKLCDVKRGLSLRPKQITPGDEYEFFSLPFGVQNMKMSETNLIFLST